ncbi:MAG: CPBP family intramembrane metalloprotease [Eubacterium sp.]|nr:CPBP family intramembrane metalloprotease [Eubacterium sp.]
MKKNKVKYFFLSFLPILLCFGLQFLISIPFIEIIILRVITSGQSNLLEVLPESLLENLSNTNFTGGISFAFAIANIIIFGIWYRKISTRYLSREHKAFSIRSNGVLILLSIVIYYSSNYVTMITSTIFPNAMDYYNNLIDTSGLVGSNISVLMIIYALFLGPIGEELIFRGVTLSYARMALPFWLANLMQAALFGVLHANLIQGVYAFVIGLFLGYIRHDSGTIRASIHLHIMFNIVGLLVSPYLPHYSGSSLFLNIIILVAVFFVALLLCRWFHKSKHPSRR